MRTKILSVILILSSVIIYTQETKTITGYVVDQDNNPWNNQIAELYEAEQLVAVDTIRAGNFTFEDISIVSVYEEHNPSTFTLYQNYPNPFNPSTIINYEIPVGIDNQRFPSGVEGTNITLTIHNILGRKIKTLVNTNVSPGLHSIEWDGTNDNGNGVAAGVYIYTLSYGNAKLSKKMVMLDGNTNYANPVVSNSITQNLRKPKIDVYDYKIIIRGEDVIRKEFTDFDLSSTGTVNLGRLVAQAKPVLVGFVYDLDTKWDYQTQSRLKPQGIDSMKVFLASNPENFVYTDSKGIFNVKLDSIPPNIFDTTGTFGPGWQYTLSIKDTIIIQGKNSADTTFYNFKTPIHKKFDSERPSPNGTHRLDNEIKYGTNIITAFNDTTGIPMIRRWTDPEKGVDLLEYTIDRLDLTRRNKGDPVWEGTATRFRDEDFPLKVYLQSPPTQGYENNTMPGFDAISSGLFGFVRTMDSTSAHVQVKYDYGSIGQGTDWDGAQDTLGSYLTFWEISIRGRPYGLVDSNLVSHIIAHEAMQIATTGGKYSPFIEDNFSIDALTKWSEGYPLESPEREKRMNKLVRDLERNTKLFQYSK
jgi:hypothetical protein